RIQGNGYAGSGRCRVMDRGRAATSAYVTQSDKPQNGPRSRDSNGGSGEEEILSLAEENEGSTQPVPASAQSPTKKSKKPSTRSEKSPSSEAAEATSTGGFETMLGKVVVDTGLVTQDEIEMCNSLLRKS